LLGMHVTADARSARQGPGRRAKISGLRYKEIVAKEA
jgi:hypothetical protein